MALAQAFTGKKEFYDELVPRSSGSSHPIQSANVEGALIIVRLGQCSNEHRRQSNLRLLGPKVGVASGLFTCRACDRNVMLIVMLHERRFSTAKFRPVLGAVYTTTIFCTATKMLSAHCLPPPYAVASISWHVIFRSARIIRKFLKCFWKQIVKIPDRGEPPGIPKAEPPATPFSSTSLFILASVHIMSSDLQSTLELLRLNDYVSRTVVHTSNQ